MCFVLGQTCISVLLSHFLRVKIIRMYYVNALINYTNYIFTLDDKTAYLSQ